MRILFVCLGNICRSPTAEGVLRQKLREAGLAERVEVASAVMTCRRNVRSKSVQPISIATI